MIPLFSRVVLGCIASLLILSCTSRDEPPPAAPSVPPAAPTIYPKTDFILDDAPNPLISLGDKALAAKDYGSALKAYQEASVDMNQKVQASALNRLGELYQRGLGVSEDLRRSFDLYEKSALLGNAYGAANLGNCYFFASGTERNLVDALRWASKGAEGDVPMALNQVGWQYLQGMGVAADLEVAKRNYERSAALGDAIGELELGWIFAHINPVDYTQAMEWYKKSAGQGNAVAENNIGFLFENGKGVTQSYNEAARWYQMSADQGYARSQFHLGILYASGNGVPHDGAKALELMRTAAASGDEAAIQWMSTH